MTLTLKYLAVLIAVMVLVGVFRIIFLIRARAMRALAATWSLQYVGPSAPGLLGIGRFPRVEPLLPDSFPRECYPVIPMTQAWNVIEGRINGFTVVLCDSVLGHETYCTIVGCQTESNPFTAAMSQERVIRDGEWVVLCRVRSLQIIPWTLGIERLGVYLTLLAVGSIRV